MAKEEESNLDKFKENYEKLRKKHNLPDFKSANEDFDIEKVSSIETDFLLREIRRHMSSKLTDFLRFLEMILNPSNSPMFMFSIVKALSVEDKKKLENAYKIITQIELELIKLDMSYSEAEEADFIRNSFKDWQKVKKETLEVYKSIKSNWNKNSGNNTKSYFG